MSHSPRGDIIQLYPWLPVVPLAKMLLIYSEVSGSETASESIVGREGSERSELASVSGLQSSPVICL